jgi:hypothetical protein
MPANDHGSVKRWKSNRMERSDSSLAARRIPARRLTSIPTVLAREVRQRVGVGTVSDRMVIILVVDGGLVRGETYPSEETDLNDGRKH